MALRMWVVLKQDGPWTYGLLLNHIQSFAGNDSRADVSATFMQPFLSYVTKTKTTWGMNSESTYDWKTNQWAVPINFAVKQMLQSGNQIYQIGAGARYWAESSSNGPEGWGFRLELTLLYPR